ncbi:hypothetical protein ACVNP1_02970 [Staphylococcus aureus]
MSNKNKSYDYVIIGGGSAGSVLGNRSSEDKDKEVLVLEAGRSDYFWNRFIQMPAALMFPSGNKFYDWIYLQMKNHIWAVVKEHMPEVKF